LEWVGREDAEVTRRDGRGCCVVCRDNPAGEAGGITAGHRRLRTSVSRHDGWLRRACRRRCHGGERGRARQTESEETRKQNGFHSDHSMLCDRRQGQMAKRTSAGRVFCVSVVAGAYRPEDRHEKPRFMPLRHVPVDRNRSPPWQVFARMWRTE